jgi:hypothetical protein
VGWFAAGLLVAHRGGKRQAETLGLSSLQGDGVCAAFLGLEATGFERLTACEELVCRLSHQLDAYLAVSSTAAAKTPPTLCACRREVSGWALELGRPRAPRLGARVEEFERFFCPVYRGVASVTRCLPCSRGKVSLTRGAGLTRPAAMAAAAWMAMSASLRASSRRRRTSQRGSGSPKWAGAGLT